jgi:hypothetical protein
MADNTDLKIINLSRKDIKSILKRLENRTLQNNDFDNIKKIIASYKYISDVLEKKNLSIRKLRNIIFGSSTESSKNILKKEQMKTNKSNISRSKQKGHGRKSSGEYKSAEKIKVSHNKLKHGDACPDCNKGKVYRMQKPRFIIRITGDAPFRSKIYELERLRCNLCLTIFTAGLPDEAGKEKYDEKAKAMVPILRYGSGFPHYRLENLQQSLGHPFPDSNQWEVIQNLSETVEPVYNKLLFQAAQGDIIHNDDTNMKILSLLKFKKELYEKQKRTGIFTSGFLSVKDTWKAALFFTGKRHAGENMEELLKLRFDNLNSPIQMCDALSRNLPKKLKTILAHCLAHCRRNFTDLILVFPKECEYVIDLFAMIYKNDAFTKENGMSDSERLQYHKLHSRKIMLRLKRWCKKKLEEKEVEPNSSLGKAINYLLNHWKSLTLFLKKEKAPIDNNICEQALKMSILHRKNSLFYKTENGARIGDMFMSLIHTCNLNSINPFDYLVTLQKNHERVKDVPEKWLPWNYLKNIKTTNIDNIAA